LYPIAMKTVFFIIVIFSTIAALAFYDAVEEGYSKGESVAYAMLPVFILLIGNWIALEVKIKKNRNSFTFAGTMALNVLVLVVYALYATNGQSGPDTAAHMHVITFPILLAIASIILLLPLLVTDFITRKKKPIR